MTIQKDSAVRIHYHLTDSEGTVIDSSKGAEPLAYLHGHGNLVPGVEAALVGQEAGAKLDVVVPPEEGYGVPDPDLDLLIPMDMFPEEAHAELTEGAMFQAPHPKDESSVAVFTVVGVDDGKVKCTANHQLAGVTLHFNLEVVEVREATAEELAHGHIHGPGGHHH
jgi:FKBP-type peptidyl-prolyl cis-trans isomerase SlyD